MLFVDDDAVICAEFARALESLGFEAKVTYMVESSLSRAAAIRFDVFLIEFNL
jgi:ActR/RegA family two-component response regulator